MRRGKQWLGFLVMVIGTGLLIGPYVMGDIETWKQESFVAELQQVLHRETATPAQSTAAPTAMQQMTAAPTAADTQAPQQTAEATHHTPVQADAEPTATAETALTAAPIEAQQARTDTPAVTPASTHTPAASAEVLQADDTPVASAAALTPTAAAASTTMLKATPAPTAAPTDTPEPTVEPTSAPTAEPQDPFFQEALAYNRLLLVRGQDDMDKLSDLEHFALNARKYGFPDNVIGTISIPRIGVEVALYLGATRDHMADGFAVFGMTSVPLGLGDENVAIAGHRGWNGSAMLRDVQMIMMGDPVYITTPWRQLTYTVTGIEIVTPNNINWCKIKPGKTMISLMTCHPYGSNTNRYIVYAELLEEDAQQTEAMEQTSMRTAAPAAVATEAPAATTASAEITAAPQAMASAGAAGVPAAETAAVIAAPDGGSAAPIAAAGTPAAIDPLNTAAGALPTIAALPGGGTVEPAETTRPVIAAAAVNDHPASTPTTTAQLPARQAITMVHDDGTREIIYIDTAAVSPDEREYGTEWSNTLILAENSMRPVAYITAGVVALVGLWLLIATISDARKAKRGKHDDEK